MNASAYLVRRSSDDPRQWLVEAVEEGIRRLVATFSGSGAEALAKSYAALCHNPLLARNARISSTESLTCVD